MRVLRLGGRGDLAQDDSVVFAAAFIDSAKL